MKTKNLYIILISLSAMFGTALPSHCECETSHGITFSNVRAGFTKSGDYAGLEMNVDLKNAKIGRNQRIILRPLLCGKTDTVQFTPLVINGRTAAITYRRNANETVSGAKVVDIKSKNQQIAYSSRVPFANWMNQATVYVVEDKCGCGVTNGGSLASTEPVASINRVVTPQYKVAYILPEVEAVKERAETGSAYIDFPVNQTTINRSYHQNDSELSKIVQTIRLVKNDLHISIEHITIHGYASPEGTYASNARLASGRARVLTEYVAALSDVPLALFSTESTPEDWDGLIKYLKTSNMSDASNILAIISSESDLDRREAIIRQRYPQAYSELLSSVYPKLRHSDYTIRYSVRAFTLEEAREYINTHPTYLSLDEYFKVANSYRDEPAMRAKVLYKAASIFADNETAQLNAACVAIEQDDLKTATLYLNHAGNSAEARNARGIVEILRGDYAAAREHLNSAAADGCIESKNNLAVVDALEGNAAVCDLSD